MSQQKYPVGIETFSKVIEGGYAYVDKTKVIYQLLQSGSQYVFLSRPRRFGKSLMLSTMEAFFEGRKELFKGLWLGEAQGVEWSARPVLRLNLVSVKSDPESLTSLIEQHLEKWEKIYEVEPSIIPLELRLFNVIEHIFEKHNQQVVILIDEYDKPLVNTLHDAEAHNLMKSILKPVYSVLKRADRYIKFAILTGVSRFSKLSIFSDINNLKDISLNDRYSTLCGITEDEVRKYLKPGIENFALEMNTDFEGMMQILKDNYDGYHFSEKSPDIYNPFSLINALDDCKISHRWFESGTPTFLMEKIRNSDEDLKDILAPVISARTLMNTSISDESLTNILYQTGYLTIKHYDPEEDEYTLGLPNKEVATGVYENLLPFYTGNDVKANDDILRKMRKHIKSGIVE